MTQHEDVQNQHTLTHAAEDEIDLADLLGVIYRWRWLIVACTLMFTCAGVGASYLMAKEYRMTTFLEIGQLLTGTGEEQSYRPVETPAAVKSRIKSLAQLATNEMAPGNNSNSRTKKRPPVGLNAESLKIEAPEEGSIVEISGNVPEKSRADVYLSRVNELLITDHRRIFDQRRTALHNKIDQKKIEKKTLQVDDKSLPELQEQIKKIKRNYTDKRLRLKAKLESKKRELTTLQVQAEEDAPGKTLPELEAKIEQLKRRNEEETTELENKIRSQKNEIDNLERQKQLLQSRIELLDNRKQKLQENIDATQKRYENLVGSKLSADSKAKGLDAVTMMLFNSEAHRMQRYLNDLRERLYFTIPNKKESIRNKIKDLDEEIENKKAQGKLYEQKLKNLEPELQDRIQTVQTKIKELKSKRKNVKNTIAEIEQQIEHLTPNRDAELQSVKSKIETLKNKRDQIEITISSLKSKLENIITTKVLAEPYRSEEPVAPNRKMLAAGGFAGGLIISVVLAFFFEFVRVNRDRIMGPRTPPGTNEEEETGRTDAAS